MIIKANGKLYLVWGKDWDICYGEQLEGKQYSFLRFDVYAMV